MNKDYVTGNGNRIGVKVVGDMFGGKMMDNFMDKLAQKLNAQEMIKANSAADAAQMNKMQTQMAEYDAALQEIRKLGLKNAEAADKLNELIAESTQKVDELTKESIAKIEAIQAKDNSEQVEKKLQENQTEIEKKLKENKTEMEEKLNGLSESLQANKQEIEELLKKTEEYVHTEDVKVYRNVQAVVVEETAKQTETLGNMQGATGKKTTAILVLAIISLLGIAADVVINVLQLLNWKPF